jgi:hypothetical protein
MRRHIVFEIRGFGLCASTPMLLPVFAGFAYFRFRFFGTSTVSRVGSVQGIGFLMETYSFRFRSAPRSVISTVENGIARWRQCRPGLRAYPKRGCCVTDACSGTTEANLSRGGAGSSTEGLVLSGNSRDSARSPASVRHRCASSSCTRPEKASRTCLMNSAAPSVSRRPSISEILNTPRSWSDISSAPSTIAISTSTNNGPWLPATHSDAIAATASIRNRSRSTS